MIAPASPPSGDDADDDVEQVVRWLLEEIEAQLETRKAQKHSPKELTGERIVRTVAEEHFSGCDCKTWVKKWAPTAEVLLQQFRA